MDEAVSARACDFLWVVQRILINTVISVLRGERDVVVCVVDSVAIDVGCG